MLTVTQKASVHLKEMLDEAEAPEDKCIRISTKGDHLALAFGSKEPGDTTYEHEGRTVLVIDEQLAKQLDDRKVDVDGAGDKAQLVLN
jgi:Fe-S cluster assembly iron-binding protein IscA